ncbi:MAG TPA: hypothetical protein VD887_00685 [Allosphingosinicella sp.]|nr:hypothetical protein [Allosphingosinicella sp.]
MIRHLVLLTAATASAAASAQDLPARFSVACRGATTYTSLPGTARAEPWTHRMESERTWVFDRAAGTAYSRLSAERAYCSEGDVCHAAFGADVVAIIRRPGWMPHSQHTLIYSRRDNALHVVVSGYPDFVDTHMTCSAPVAL